MKNYRLLSLLIFSIIAINCKELPNPYPPEPIIDFTKMYVLDSVDALSNSIKIYDIFFKIVDGDYDFGLKESDTTGIFSHDSLYYNNLFINYWIFQDGQWTQLNIPNTNYRIPYIKPAGLNKYFKAEIDIKIDVQVAFLSSTTDSIKFSFYVVDKSLHKSNEQMTPGVSLDFSGVIVDTSNIIAQ